MAAGKEAKLLRHVRLGLPVYSTPVAANGVVHAASQQYLWAVQERQGQPEKIRQTAAKGGGDSRLPAQGSKRRRP